VGALGLVVVVGRCVEGIAGWRYSVLVHRTLLLWAVLREAANLAGASYVVNSRIISWLY
jgi:hypothetical protein